jgi:TRAP-type transport system large permease protein
MVAFLFISFVFLMLVGLDVAFSMVFASFLGIMGKATRPVDLTLIPLTMVSGADSFQLVAIPLYILTGELMNRGGVTQRLVEFSLSLIGHFKGSLAHVSVVTNMIMAGVSGAAVADAAATGAVLIPAMKRDGYGAEYASAVIASAAVIGPIIPPSIPMIVYAVLANQSVAKLFMAGMIPGILLGIGFMIVCAVVAKRRNFPSRQRATWHESLIATGRAGWSLMLPVIIIGGIVFGVMTCTEAAAVAVVYALIIGLFIHRDLKFKNLIEGIYEAGITSGIIMILLSAAGIFGWLLAESKVDAVIVEFMLGITRDPTGMLLLVNLLLLIIGCFLEPLPAMIIFFPALSALGIKIGMDPIHLGLVMVLNLMIGMLTPPVGFLLFIVSAIGNVRMVPLVREVYPFLIISLLVLLASTLYPPLATWMPSLIK